MRELLMYLGYAFSHVRYAPTYVVICLIMVLPPRRGISC